MESEGKGKVPPRPIAMILSTQEILIIRNIAEERSDYHHYSGSRSTWKQGLTGDAITPIIMGRAGEYAVEKYLGVIGDTSLKPNGDGGVDLVINGRTLQIKTRRRAKHANLIRRVTDRKKICKLEVEILVFCQNETEENVSILGWIFTRDARLVWKFKRSPLSNAKHWNLVIDDAELLPIKSLKEELRLPK
jgi:hypothetical protein